MIRFVKIAAALAAVLVPLFFGGTVAAAAEKTSLSYVTWNADYGYIMAAIDKGYFAEEGLDVDLTSAGGGVAVPALVSGNLDFTGSGSSAISAILKGAKLKVVMVGQDRPGWQLWSAKPELKTLADLKDSQVAVISRGDSGEIALRYLLKLHNLPRDYFAFTPLGNGTARLAAISTGSIPAGVMVWGEVEKLKTDGGLAKGHLISNLTAEVHMPFNGLATSDKLIADKPDLVMHMVRALLKGQTYIRSNRGEAIAMIAKYSKEDEKDAASDYDHIQPAIAKDGTVPASVESDEIGLRSEMMDIAAGQRMKPEDVFDFAPARQAIASLNASNWKPSP
ncbi:MAG TPA: ABC transporter substrate-binding protein [Stellaceae bacterium]|nr:ABC transporter substrate-binding protein [Stellaceae bacterium]